MPSILLNRSTLWGRWLFVKILTKMNDCAISHEIPWKRNIFLLQYWLLCMDVWIISKCCDKNFHKFSHTWFVYAALKFSWVSNLSHNNLLVIWFGGIFFLEKPHAFTATNSKHVFLLTLALQYFHFITNISVTIVELVSTIPIRALMHTQTKVESKYMVNRVQIGYFHAKH